MRKRQDQRPSEVYLHFSITLFFIRTSNFGAEAEAFVFFKTFLSYMLIVFHEINRDEARKRINVVYQAVIWCRGQTPLSIQLTNVRPQFYIYFTETIKQIDKI